MEIIFYQVTQDDKPLMYGSHDQCFIYIQRHQSSSVDRAIKYEGWKIVPQFPLHESGSLTEEVHLAYLANEDNEPQRQQVEDIFRQYKEAKESGKGLGHSKGYGHDHNKGWLKGSLVTQIKTFDPSLSDGQLNEYAVLVAYKREVYL